MPSQAPWYPIPISTISELREGLNSFHISFLGIMQRAFPFVGELESPSKIAAIFIRQSSCACLKVSMRMMSVDY